MRYNIFNQIHKALRALMYGTALTLQQTHFTNPEETEVALEKLRLVLDAFDQHADHEDDFVLPAIQRYEPSLVDAFEQEHVEDHELSAQLRTAIILFENTKEEEEQLLAGNAIMHSFIAFMTFNLNHMAKEESVLNERLWRYYSDAEIIGINQQLIASIPPEELGFASSWMMKGLSNAEIISWLKAVQKNAPDFVFNGLFNIAEKELPNQRFRKVLEELTEGAMLA